MLDIPLRKIANIILMAHELNRASAELRSFIDTLAKDQQASLVALMWVGRGSFEPEDLAEAKRTAMAEATTPPPIICWARRIWPIIWKAGSRRWACRPPKRKMI